MAPASAVDIIRVVLLAFFGGLTVPLVVQLFLTLRTIQRAANTIERRVDEVSRDITSVAASLRREPGPPDLLSAFAGAAVPAVIAAVQAFRAQRPETPVPYEATVAPGEKTP